jgi:muramoyltetrapeptide carboxypeptidase
LERHGESSWSGGRNLSIPAVRRGSRVAVISPASYPQPETAGQGSRSAGPSRLCTLGGPASALQGQSLFAGSAQARLEDLHAAFLDPAAGAIFCSRGGYGSNYLLGSLDLGLVREHPKPFIAHSDMTCMQTWLLDQIGLVSFHGPMVAGDFAAPDGVDEASLLAALGGERWFVGEASGLRTLIPGKATGVLYGGCLTLLAASLGTPYAPRTEGKLLFLEDRDVKPYQLDRLLRQMILAGKFEGSPESSLARCSTVWLRGRSRSMLDEVILRVLDWFQGRSRLVSAPATCRAAM